MAIAEVSAPANLGLATVSRKDGSGEGNLTFGEGFGLSFFLCEPVADEGAEHVPTNLFVWTEAFCYKSLGNATG
jgi:hypothetical protein